jgi:hypothetical protein
LNRPIWSRGLSGLLSFATLAAALVIAAHHPLVPAWALVGVAVAMLVEARWPGIWLFLLPATLPWLDFSPWTGGLAFQEFDLLVLALFAAGHARLAWAAPGAPTIGIGRLWMPWLAFVALSLVALWRGWDVAQPMRFDWFQGYADPLNAVRIGKSTLYAVLAMPLVERVFNVAPERALTRFCAGMVVGLAVVTCAAIAERALYPGLLDLTTPYRTVALFWEMHVGGAAIDAYFALAMPFAAWALWTARNAWGWGASAVLALASVYACLTTFSRGACIAVAGSLLLLALLLALRRSDDRLAWIRAGHVAAALAGMVALLIFAYAALGSSGVGLALTGVALTCVLSYRVRQVQRAKLTAAALLALVLLAEVVVLLGESPFMRTRLAAGYDDAGSRREHWASGLRLLQSPADWLFGRGLGRLPADYDRAVPGGGFSGTLERRTPPGSAPLVRLSGPRTSEQLGGTFGINQHVELAATYMVRLDIRSTEGSRLELSVCQRYLLYDGRCQLAQLRVAAGDPSWRRYAIRLRGPALQRASRPTLPWLMFELAVLDPGGVDLRHVSLSGPDGRELLSNGDFSQGLAHWQTAAQSYFTPWHIDNLFLEVLIERGAPALVAFIAVVAVALARWLNAVPRIEPAAFVACALCAALVVGSVSSIFDVPRVAFLLQLMIVMGVSGVDRMLPSARTRRAHPSSGARPS